MWIQVRTIDGTETQTIDDLSRLTKIECLREKIQETFRVSPDRQRLFYRGKQVRRSRPQPPAGRGLFVRPGAGTPRPPPAFVRPPSRRACGREPGLTGRPEARGALVWLPLFLFFNALFIYFIF